MPCAIPAHADRCRSAQPWEVLIGGEFAESTAMAQVSEPHSVPRVFGTTGFPALLLERKLVRQDALATAETHATREDMALVDALVALGLLSELDAYSVLAEAAGASHVVLDDAVSTEFAIRLVPERLARRHLVVPLDVEHRTLTYATCCPFSAEAERDLTFASGRRVHLMVASRSSVLAALDRCYPKLRELDVLAER